MAKRIITTILQNYCGRYIDGISPDNIEASVWSGEVSLKNLRIKPKALDFLELPIPVVIRKGHIGTLDAVVPYTSLSSQSTTITIHDVFLTVGIGFIRIYYRKCRPTAWTWPPMQQTA